MKAALWAGLLAASLSSLAADITVKNAWAKATVPGQPVSGAYFEITAAKPAKLLGVASPAAGMVEVHEMKMDGGVMKMRAVDSIALPAGKTVSLQPGGYHVMLMQLNAPLKAGGTLPLTLHVEQGGKPVDIQVVAQIKPVTAE